MDLLTQGLIGSGIAQSVAKPQEIRKAALIGFIAGIAADVDIFIQSANDPLLNLEYHRHFTHSIFFIPFAALLLSFLLWPFFRKQLGWKRIYLYAFGGYLLSGFIDACTSYGTRLLWPLSDERISFSIISIIDPVFTLIVLVAVIIGVIREKHSMTQLLLLVALGYLLLGAWQQSRIEAFTRELAQRQGHEIERLLVKPTLANNWLWRAVYQSNGYYYVNAVRINPFSGDTTLYAGSRIRVFSPSQNHFQLPADSVMQNDIRRFAGFSSHYLALHPDNPNIIIDVRYSNLPDSVLPLWGIRIDPLNPQQHARYEVYHDTSRQMREAFIAMLLNQKR